MMENKIIDINHDIVLLKQERSLANLLAEQKYKIDHNVGIMPSLRQQAVGKLLYMHTPRDSTFYDMPLNVSQSIAEDILRVLMLSKFTLGLIWDTGFDMLLGDTDWRFMDRIEKIVITVSNLDIDRIDRVKLKEFGMQLSPMSMIQDLTNPNPISTINQPQLTDVCDTELEARERSKAIQTANMYISRGK
jgi:hypothetical protein